MIILEILLWILRIILIVLVFLGVLLIVPVRLCVKYGEELELTVKYLFFKIPIDLEQDEEKLLRKEEKEEKKQLRKVKKKEKKNRRKSNAANEELSSKKTASTAQKTTEQELEKKENNILQKLKALKKKKGLEGVTELLKEIARLVSDLNSSIIKHIIIQKFDMNIVVAFEDAGDTAVKYGYACAGIYPAVAVILKVFRYKDYNISITPDFSKKKTETALDAEITTLTWFIVVGLVQILIRYLKLKTKKLL